MYLRSSFDSDKIFYKLRVNMFSYVRRGYYKTCDTFLMSDYE